MTNSMGLKKKLLIGVLTAALCASTCAGGLLIEANAEGVDAADLVTATGGATVTAAKSYTTSAGDFTTPAGLYIAAPDDKSLSYGAELNGIFTGSTGIKAYFPGEGFWGAAAQTTITVTSVADIGEKFQVHIGGEWQRYGYVTYDWNGETLYRTVNSYADNSTYYYREDNVKDVGSAQYLPIQGWMESDGGRNPISGLRCRRTAPSMLCSSADITRAYTRRSPRSAKKNRRSSRRRKRAAPRPFFPSSI